LVLIQLSVRLVSTEHYSLAHIYYLCWMYIGEWFYLQDKSITDNQQYRSSKRTKKRSTSSFQVDM